MNKKSFIFLLLILISIMGILFVSFISAEHANKIGEEVYKSLGQNNKVRVIINLKEPSEMKGFIFKTQKTKSEIEQEKQKIKQQIISQVKNKDVKHIFDKSLAIEISKGELNKLENNPNVKSIALDSPVKAFSQYSIPLIGANLVWPKQISGINITGIGETICVLDTGIDFTHPDLIGKNKTCIIDCLTSTSCTENCSIGDDNGHGTHVAGIIAASGGIDGVAIGSKLIGVKVLDSNGSGSDSDVDAGIKWCTANAKKYNISVISMSLGGQTLYSSYCNNNSLAPSINNATYNNISVIVATGNNASTTGISSPACIQNATAVGATNENDTIASYSNRNNITDLLAPGTDINSTVPTGNCTFCSPSGYNVLSGTSMAAPHVAGAFTLIRQFFRLQSNIILTPSEILNALKSTGKKIYDSNGSGLNFTRINVYSAIVSLDNKSPNVTLISPLNNSLSSNKNQTFSCNSTDDIQLNNITFYLWNSSNDAVNRISLNISGTSNESSFNLTNISYGNYKWNCLAYDDNNNFAFFTSNYSRIIKQIDVSLISPDNNSFTNDNQTNFTCQSRTDSKFSLSNTTFYLWNSTKGLIYNSTKDISGIFNSTNFQYNFSNETIYYWNCKSYNNNSNFSSADSNYSISYDISSPNVSLISPANLSSYTSNSKKIIFDYNVSDNFNIANCSLIINNAIIITHSTITNFSLTQNFTKTFAPSEYTWQINCADSAGNIQKSGQRKFILKAPQIIQSSSGGGGGGGSSESPISKSVYILSKEQFSKGYTEKLAKRDKIQFTFLDDASEKHTLSVNFIGNNFVNLTIRSKPLNIILETGQGIKLNLTSKEYYDLYVKLKGIIDKKAVITIQTIHEEIPKPKPINITKKVLRKEDVTSHNEKGKPERTSILKRVLESIKKMKNVGYVLIAILIIVVIFIIIEREKKYFYGNKEKENKNFEENKKT